MHFQPRSAWHDLDSLQCMWTHGGCSKAGGWAGPRAGGYVILLGSQGYVSARARVPKVTACQQREAAHDFPLLCGIAED